MMLTAMRADGTEFPVEVAIRRLEIPGPPVFTGFIRDLTARLAAEAEVAASRARLVTAHTTERRRLERNLHDGAQQRLVALALRLRIARKQLDTAPEHVGAELEEASEELALALSELREISRGLHPAVLTDLGLEAAITAVCARATVPVDVDVEVSADPAESLQAAAYYVVAEALTNVAKYACASSASVCLRAAGSRLSVDVRDDGVGGADQSQGSGLSGLTDRVEALGGRLEIESPPGEGTRIRAELPLCSAGDDAQRARRRRAWRRSPRCARRAGGRGPGAGSGRET